MIAVLKQYEQQQDYDTHPVGMTMQFPVADQRKVNEVLFDRRADAHEQIAELKRQSGKDILVFGSHILWNDLLANDLVDELHLMIGQVILGAGTPVFDGRPAVSLRLIDTRTFSGSENVLVRYKVRRQKR